MSPRDTENSGTTPVREAYQFNELALARWMTANIEGFLGPLKVEQFKGGQSNPTYKLITSTRHFVLRRKPPGPLLKGAHAIEREARVLTALEEVDFPVAHVYGLCTDDTVIGTAFYVMEMIEGRIFWDATLPAVPRNERPAYFQAMNETIARLHNIEYAEVGLAGYGGSGNYFERQIARWSQQYTDDIDAGRNDEMDQLIEWLPRNIPLGEEAAIVHGDFRIDNLVFHAVQPRVIAVLDWELSTIGHPLADFSYHLMMYYMPPHIVAGLVGTDLAALNIPSEADYVAAYCQHTRRSGIADLSFYIAFNFFRMAAIFHGIKGRAIRGTASSAAAIERAKSFPELARIAWERAGL